MDQSIMSKNFHFQDKLIWKKKIDYKVLLNSFENDSILQSE